MTAGFFNRCRRAGIQGSNTDFLHLCGGVPGIWRYLRPIMISMISGNTCQ
jgi:hypothetical protein